MFPHGGYHCINRLLENWEPLRDYFSSGAVIKTKASCSLKKRKTDAELPQCKKQCIKQGQVDLESRERS